MCKPKKGRIHIMAIKMSEFLTDLKELRKGVNPQEKIRQLQELKQRSQFKSPEKAKSESVSPTLIVLSADPQQRKEANSNEEKSE